MIDKDRYYRTLHKIVLFCLLCIFTCISSLCVILGLEEQSMTSYIALTITVVGFIVGGIGLGCAIVGFKLGKSYNNEDIEP